MRPLFRLVDVALITLLCINLSGSRPLADDPGVGWHLKTGELVLRSWGVPRQDPFLCGSPVLTWVSDQWLSDALLWLAYQAGGWEFLALLSVTAYLCTFVLLPFSALSGRAGLPALAVLTAALVSYKLGLVQLMVRPVVFSFAIFAAGFYLARRWSKSSRELSGGDAASALGLGALGANVHPCFVLLYVPFAAATLAAGLRKGVFSSLRTALLSVLPFAAGTLINPFGLELYAAIIAHPSGGAAWSGDPSPYIHEEWLPLSWMSFEGALTASVVAIVTIAALVRHRAFLREHAFDLLCAVPLLLLAAGAVRFLPYLAIASVPALASALAAFCEYAGRLYGFRLAADPLRRLEQRESAPAHRFVPFMAALTIAVSLALRGELPSAGRLAPSTEKFPYGAMEFLIGESRGPQCIAAPAYWGGFVTLHGFPRVKPLADDRDNMIGKERYREHHDALKRRSIEYFSGRGASYLLLPRHAAAPDGEISGAGIVYRDDTAVLYELSDEPGRSLRSALR